ncbi:PUCC protein [[Leptolyngbya] sp. PCC 7376]|uniref:BCD family MFS transporter n=1 Tax=[Leptolyngbya] sp. PCC 7376 TaxID=111781 RepID=UPI00029F039F|nr:BCD family MFS transporter [[Leptolyngbya] sp. PCC 7376]AFY38252.1 PUCC protein [[Leptolyngbya] sp. PCC 7376]
MTISDLSQSPPDRLPSVGPLTMMRLGLFNMGLGLMAVLTLAVLNRVMISELDIPATVTAGALAVPQFMAPARVFFGQLSDSKKIFGLHRSGYVWIGTILFGSAVFLAVQIVWKLAAIVQANGGWIWTGETTLWTIALGSVLGFYGLALSSSSTPFTALLVDISEEKTRSKIVAVVWSMLLVGVVIGGISGSIFLSKVQQSGVILGANVGSMISQGEKLLNTPLDSLRAPINSLFIIAPAIAFSLGLLGTIGVERKYSRFRQKQSVKQRDDQITFAESLKIVTTSRQTAIFFTFLVIFTISLFMQEAVLEPYGGEVFGMSIGESTLLNSYWGMGVLAGYSATGFFVVPKLGKKNTARLGCVLTAACFGLMILAGVTQQPNILKYALVLFGAATGIGTIGAISLMLDLTAAETAGTFIGTWALAQAMSRAIATLLGGVVLDIGRAIFEVPLLAYSSVFALQAIGMTCAVLVLNRVNVREFKENTKQVIATVLEGELDG